MTVSGDDVEAIGDKLTLEGEKVNQWMLANKLKLNADKTHLLTLVHSRD